MSTITKVCTACQESFEASLREHKRGHAKFCSRSCASRFNTLKRSKENCKPNVECAYCGKQFYKNAGKQLLSKSGLFFCCRIHKDFGQRLEGIKAIHPSHYGRGDGRFSYRERALRELPNQCNRCSYSRFIEALMVHHIDHNRSNNNISNLEILCPTCHWEHHLGLVS